MNYFLIKIHDITIVLGHEDYCTRI